MGRIYRNQFNCIYLRKIFRYQFFADIGNLHPNVYIFKTNVTLIGYVFVELETANDVVS